MHVQSRHPAPPLVLSTDFMTLLKQCMPAFAGLHIVGEGLQKLSPEIRQRATDEAMAALFALGFDNAAGQSQLAATQYDRLSAHYLKVLSDEDTARQHLGLKPREQVETSKQLAALAARMDAIAEAAPKSKKSPLFSAAADSYIQAMIGARGKEHKEITYLRARTACFIALMGDKPVAEIGKNDIQAFINKIGWLPANAPKGIVYNKPRLLALLAENEAKKGESLAAKTITDTYVSRAKTIIKHGLESADLPYTLSTMRFLMPSQARPSKERGVIAPSAFDRALCGAVFWRHYDEALLLCLGRLTGRRLGQLATLRFENISYDERLEAWIVTPQSHQLNEANELQKKAHKTIAALKPFVLHAVFEERFLQWARARKGPMFPTYASAASPENTAQKAVDRLLEKISILPPEEVRGKYGSESRRFKRPKEFTFHETRNSRISDYNSTELKERAVMLQVGHELGTEHRKYGRLEHSEAQLMRTLKLPEGIDWSAFDQIDFNAIAPSSAALLRKTLHSYP
jgi:integrase